MDTDAAGYHSQHIEPEEERKLSIPPGAIVLALGVLLVGIVVIGIAINRNADTSTDEVTIAELLADPDRYDNKPVELVGRADQVREIPYLSQYAIYTFRDDTGTMLALTQNGAPPDMNDDRVRLHAIYHARVTLDDELRRIVEDQFGSIVGWAVETFLPGIPLNVVFLEHQRYELVEPDA